MSPELNAGADLLSQPFPASFLRCRSPFVPETPARPGAPSSVAFGRGRSWTPSTRLPPGSLLTLSCSTLLPHHYRYINPSNPTTAAPEASGDAVTPVRGSFPAGDGRKDASHLHFREDEVKDGAGLCRGHGWPRQP